LAKVNPVIFNKKEMRVMDITNIDKFRQQFEQIKPLLSELAIEEGEALFHIHETFVTPRIKMMVSREIKIWVNDMKNEVMHAIESAVRCLDCQDYTLIEEYKKHCAECYPELPDIFMSRYNRPFFKSTPKD
jgi:hypothetical protein